MAAAAQGKKKQARTGRPVCAETGLPALRLRPIRSDSRRLSTTAMPDVN